jgi:hypothetical protein
MRFRQQHENSGSFLLTAISFVLYGLVLVQLVLVQVRVQQVSIYVL